MQAIQKRKNEPAELADFKKRMHEGEVVYSNTYDALYNDDEGAFSKFQLTLANEQGFICAYCQQSIANEQAENLQPIQGMKVEHFKPKSVYNGKNEKDDLRIEYTNLLAVCSGKITDTTITHCDTPPLGKGKRELLHLENPAFWNSNKFNPEIRFSKICNIYSTNKSIDAELNEILNLNTQILRENRSRALKGIKKQISKEIGSSDWTTNVPKTKDQIEKYLKIYKKKTTKGSYFTYKPFRSCIIFQLEKWLKKYS